MSNTTWKASSHQPIEALTENLWRVAGGLDGMPFKRVMTLARLADGRVVVHSAVALDEPSMHRIEAWGTPSILVVPSAHHRMDAPRFVARYPQLSVLCPPAASDKVKQVVRVSGGYDLFPTDPRVSLELLDGTAGREGVLRVVSDRGTTLVFNDVLFNTPHFGGVAGFMLRYVTASTGGPRVSRIAKLALVKDRRAFAAHLRRLADTEGLRRVIVAHENVIDDRPAEVLREVADTLA